MKAVEAKSMEQMIRDKVSEITKGHVTFVHVSEIYELQKLCLKAIKQK